jgi:hypothetical protein
MLIRPKFDTEKWAEENFHDCDLGDRRRARRLELFAGQAAKRSAASLPKIGEDWGGTKGIYRLLDRPEATLESVTQAHRNLMRQKEGRFLITCDTTHVDFGCQRKLPDAGPIGPGAGQGFLLHSGLLVDTEDSSLVGLAGQVFGSWRNLVADSWPRGPFWLQHGHDRFTSSLRTIARIGLSLEG